ncbi:uncharacterized protein LOC126802150 [Argentina anserina]|uniref:uncharacterized protein LOC126802150 n=1 Tax=Argentina anserina TaxID=57926 RepID=UPI0021766D9E|nr:uncharacterized protein LOC126802150 [Potentilla anserina]
MKSLEEQVFNIFTDDIYLVIRGQMVFENQFIVSSHIDYEDSRNLTLYVTQYGVEDRYWLVTYVGRPEDEDGDTYTCSCQLLESDGACRYAKLIGIAKRACYNMSLTNEGFETGVGELNSLVGKHYAATRVKKARLNLDDNENVVMDPVGSRTKGTHGHKAAEGNVNRNEGVREGTRCGECHNPGHNRRTCPDIVKGDASKGRDRRA